MPNFAGLQAIIQRTEELGWLPGVQHHLRRDGITLLAWDAPACFGWSIRAEGTLLACPNQVADIWQCIRYHQWGLTHQHYWFDGTALQTLDFAAFIAQLEDHLDPHMRHAYHQHPPREPAPPTKPHSYTCTKIAVCGGLGA